MMSNLISKIKVVYQKFRRESSGKLFISYLLVLAVPFVLLSIYLGITAYHNQQRRVLETQTRQLEQTSTKLAGLLDQLDTLALDMGVNQQVENPLKAIDTTNANTQEALKHYGLLTQGMQGIAIIYDDYDKVYSHEGVVDKSRFFEVLAQREALAQADIARALRSKAPYVLANRQVFIYMTPFFKDHRVVGRVIYQLAMASVQDDIVASHLDESSSLLVYQKGQPLLVFGATLPKRLVDLSLSQLQAQHPSYNMSPSRRAHSDLELVILMPKGLFWQDDMRVYLTIMLMMLLCLLASTAVAFLMSHRQYRPMYQLKQVYTNLASNQSLHVTEPLENQIGDYLFWAHERLDQVEKGSYQERLTYFYSYLIQGIYSDEASLAKALQKYQLTGLSGEYFGVVICDASNLQSVSGLVGAFPIQTPHFRVDAIDALQKDQLAFVVSYYHAQISEEVVASRIQTALKSPISLQFGRSVAALHLLSVSYTSALVKQADKGEHKRYPSTILPIDKANQLILTIKQGNQDALRQILGSLTSDRALLLDDPKLAMSYDYYVYNRLLYLANQKSLRQAFIAVSGQNDQEDMMQKNNLLANWLLAQLQARQVPEDPESSEGQILKQINQHYSQADFSLELLAKHFNVSLSKMSQMVKAACGKTFSKQLQTLRLEKAKMLLRTSDLAIKEIVEAVGYVDVANFTRKFRQEIGQTPSQYRKETHE